MPFTAPTAANISSYLVISAAKSYRTFRLYKHTSRVSILFTSQFYKWRAAIWESNTLAMLLQAISFIRPQYAPLHFIAFSLAGSVIRGHLLRQWPLIPAHKAKPHSSAQLLSMLHQPAFISFHSLRSFRSSFTQSLSQPHSSILNGYMHSCQLTFWLGRSLAHTHSTPQHPDLSQPHTT
jgi:hypothetical protein